jgi:type 1 glutamine amidotransferase
MGKRVLVLSQNDKWHKSEDLGTLIETWAQGLAELTVEGTHDRGVLGRAALAAYDACVICASMEGLTDAEERGLASYVEDGGAVVGIHGATVTDEDSATYIDLIGARFDHHPKYAPFEVRIAASGHPVVAGLDATTYTDELYVLDRSPGGATVLATAEWEGSAQPMVYTRSYGKGKVLYIALGHDAATFEHPAFRRLVVQGLRWACGAT